MEEQVISINFDKTPDIRIRVIDDADTEPTKQNKIKYPFELFNTIMVHILTNKRMFRFDIPIGFVWDGATINRIFWRIIGSKTDNSFLISSMLHDYLLDEAIHIINKHIKEKISINEYICLTTLIFKEELKNQGVNKIKANIMGSAVHIFQLCLKKKWKKIFRQIKY